MMETALQLLGTFLVIDLLFAFALVVLVAIVGRRGRIKVPWVTLVGALLFLALSSALIYGGLWLVLRYAP